LSSNESIAVSSPFRGGFGSMRKSWKAALPISSGPRPDARGN